MNMSSYTWLTVPNLLTFIRIVLTPFVAYSIMIGSWGAASFLFFICATSDLLDGFVARAFNQQSFIGTCLDPIADKFFVIVSFCALAVSPFSIITVPRWFVGLMIIKELLLVLGVLFFYFGAQKRIQVCPSLYGKLAACTQMISLYMIILFSYFTYSLFIFGSSFFVLLAFIMILAFLDYCSAALYVYTKGRV